MKVRLGVREGVKVRVLVGVAVFVGVFVTVGVGAEGGPHSWISTTTNGSEYSPWMMRIRSSNPLLPGLRYTTRPSFKP